MQVTAHSGVSAGSQKVSELSQVSEGGDTVGQCRLQLTAGSVQGHRESLWATQAHSDVRTGHVGHGLVGDHDMEHVEPSYITSRRRM